MRKKIPEKVILLSRFRFLEAFVHGIASVRDEEDVRAPTTVGNKVLAGCQVVVGC